MCFFHLIFLNARGILVESIYNVHAIFCQFSDVKNRGQSQQPSVFSQLVTSEPQRVSSATNATLFSLVFFACGVHINCIIYLITS